MWGNGYSGFDGVDEDDPGYQGNDVTCGRCGAERLDWYYTGVRWRLLNSDGAVHVCNTAASADEFEVVV